MESKTVPSLDRRVSCIAGDIPLAASISSYFNDPETYFVTVYAPRLWLLFDERRKAKNVQIHNPDTVVLVGLDKEQLKALKPLLKGYKLIVIKSAWQITWKLWRFHKKFDGELRCKAIDVSVALLHAKRNNLKLIVDESADDFNIDRSDKKTLVVLEARGDLSDVISANYAFAFDSDLIMIKGVERSVAGKMDRQLSDINQMKKKNRSEAIKMLVKLEQDLKAIADIDISNYESATFITYGLPYGICYRGDSCVCHVFRYPSIGEFFLNNIWLEHHESFIGVGLMFAPYRFEEEEHGGFDEVYFVMHKLAVDCMYYALSLEEEKATVQSLENFMHHYPLELIHITSHGGEGDGYRCNFKFEDPNGERHELIVEEAISAKPGMVKFDKSGNAKVISKFFFENATIDGIPWFEYSFEKLPAELRDYVIQTIKPTRERIKFVRGSNQIFCADGASFASIHATILSPVVFNNSCCSMSQLGSTIIAAGAKCYIGTNWSVGARNATLVACAFYENIMKDTLLKSLWKAMSLHLDPADVLEWKNYIFVGTHFSTLRPTGLRPKEPLAPILRRQIAKWESRRDRKDAPEEWKQKCSEVIEFLSGQLNSFEGAYKRATESPEFISTMRLYNLMIDCRGCMCEYDEVSDLLSKDLLNTSQELLCAAQY